MAVRRAASRVAIVMGALLVDVAAGEVAAAFIEWRPLKISEA